MNEITTSSLVDLLLETLYSRVMGHNIGPVEDPKGAFVGFVDRTRGETFKVPLRALKVGLRRVPAALRPLVETFEGRLRLFGGGTPASGWPPTAEDMADAFAEIEAHDRRVEKVRFHPHDYALFKTSCENLLDEDYEQEIGFPQAGRSVEFGLTFDL